MNTTKKHSERRARKHTLKNSEATVNETRVVFFGNASDPEVKASMEKVKACGREAQLVARPSYDTGLGMCGQHLCHCKTVCVKELNQSLKQA